ncbi:MAG: reverse transcriptase, partial [Myxococcota bacterium]
DDCNAVLAMLKVSQHPDKIFIGRTSRGFDCLGYHVAPEGLTVATATVDRMLERALRLYEQHADEERVGVYVRWWMRCGMCYA